TNAAADGAVAYGKPGATADGDKALEVAPGATTGIVTQAGTTLPAGGAPRTVEGWVRATNCCDVSLVLARYGTAGAGKLFEVYVQEGFSVRPRMYLETGSGSPVHVDLPTRWADGAYHQLAATYNGSVFTAYLDGQAAGSVKVGALATVAEGFSFGSPNQDGFLMDEVAVYPSALTPGRIDSHWSHGVALRAACPAKPTRVYPESVLHDSPALYLRLNEDDRLVRDYSGHCADGSTNA